MSDAVIQTALWCGTTLISVWSVLGLACYAIYKTKGNVDIGGGKHGHVKTGECAR